MQEAGHRVKEKILWIRRGRLPPAVWWSKPPTAAWRRFKFPVFCVSLMASHTSALNDVLLLLLAAALVVPLFQRLRSSPVLGYLVAGMLIGPHGFAILSDVAETVGLAHFGVVFLLFTIGLELSLERLKVMRHTVFGLGTAQVIVTGAAIALVGWQLGIAGGAVLVLAGGMAMSSTAIVLQILVERSELTARHGRIAFSILLLQDLAVVLLLPLVTVMGGPGGLGGPGGAAGESLAGVLGLVLAKAVAALLLIVVAGRLVVRPMLRTVAEARSPELFTGLTLLVVLGVSWLTEQAGLSMALGAFLAGLILAETEYRHQVEADIAPFRGILLALFFMTVGMAIDFRLLLDRAAEVSLLVLALMGGKALILLGLCRVFGFAWGLSLHVALTLAQGSEFAFVLLTLAGPLDIIPDDTSQMIQLVVAVSMALTPVTMTVARRLARKMVPVPAASLERLHEETGDLRNHVLIAGFGRVGQTLATLLKANSVPYVALDLEPKRVSEGRARGLPVFYGDASRAEVVKAAGASHARAVVVTLDHPKAAERTVRAIRHQWPRLPIFVRARDIRHRPALQEAGATTVVPEMIEGSLHLGSMLLRSLGRPPEQVSRTLKQFRDEAYASLDELIPARPHVADTPQAKSTLKDDAEDPRR